MFRDLKEYQEIAKIYADKVSKPEDLEERVKGGGVPTNPVKPFEKPAPQVSGNRGNRPQMKGGIEIKKVATMGLNLSDISKPKKKDKSRTAQSIKTETDYLKQRQKVAPYGAKYSG